MNTPIETERKFLIRMPCLSDVHKQNELRVKSIKQTYLLTCDGTNARVRELTENGKTGFLKTVKKRISSLSCYEEEFEISEERYTEELKNADTTKNTITKTRYAFPFAEHTIEIDIFPFWSDRAILEVELTAEDEKFELPSFIEVIKEVSEDKRYKNTNLAVNIPMDII